MRARLKKCDRGRSLAPRRSIRWSLVRDKVTDVYIKGRKCQNKLFIFNFLIHSHLQYEDGGARLVNNLTNLFHQAKKDPGG